MIAIIFPYIYLTILIFFYLRKIAMQKLEL